MAQWNKKIQDYLNQERSLFEVNLISTVDGNPVTFDNPFPVSIGSSNITISGNVYVGVVTVSSTPQNPVHTHITEIGSSGILQDAGIPYMPVGIGTSNLNLSYLPVGISTLLNVVSISNTSFYVTGIGNTINISGVVSVANTVSISNTSFYVTGVGSTVNVSGTVSVGNTINVSIANTTGNPTLVKYVDSTNIQLDTNERLRITPGQQQWWYNPTTDKDGDLRLIESFTGVGATSLFIQNLSSVLITSGIGSTGSAIRISRRRHKSRPGVSHLYYTNHNFDGPQSNVLKRRGMFTNFNGIFFELGTDLSLVVRRRLVDGTIAEERVARGSFNQDNLNGLGPSGINVSDYNKTTQITSLVSAASSVAISATETVWRVGYGVTNPNAFKLGSKVTVTGITSTSYNGCAMVTGIGSTSITLSYSINPTTGSFTGISTNASMTQTFWHHYQSMFFDFNGNRSSRVRFGMVIKEGQQILHIFDLANEFGTAYSNAPAIPVRTEIINTGVPSYTPSLTIAGETFNVEAEAELNPGFGVATNNTPVVFTKNTTSEHAILGIGLRYGEPYQRGDLTFRRLQIFDTGNINPQNAGVLYWRLVLNPTIGGTGITTSYVGKASQMWTYTTGTTFSGGIDLLAGYASQNAPVDISGDLNFLNMGSNIDYTDSDKMVLIVKQLVGGIDDAKVVASIDFNENL